MIVHLHPAIELMTWVYFDWLWKTNLVLLRIGSLYNTIKMHRIMLAVRHVVWTRFDNKPWNQLPTCWNRQAHIIRHTAMKLQTLFSMRPATRRDKFCIETLSVPSLAQHKKGARYFQNLIYFGKFTAVLKFLFKTNTTTCTKNTLNSIQNVMQQPVRVQNAHSIVTNGSLS